LCQSASSYAPHLLVSGHTPHLFWCPTWINHRGLSLATEVAEAPHPVCLLSSELCSARCVVLRCFSKAPSAARFQSFYKASLNAYPQITLPLWVPQLRSLCSFFIYFTAILILPFMSIERDHYLVFVDVI
jgi:hypothetical protein